MISFIYSCFSSFFSLLALSLAFSFFFFNDTATTEIYTLSLHDALPISLVARLRCRPDSRAPGQVCPNSSTPPARSEEHTSELQSRENLVCRLLLEKKKKKIKRTLARH